MGERETHDFKSIDSFSQLPFMRRERPPSPPIRLFGVDFPPGSSAASDSNKRRSASPIAAEGGNGETIRRFECNYCFRNFPTSQALGGHQNAHKRERQHAKRASIAAASADEHLQGLLRYHGHGAPTSPRLRYPSWCFSSGSSGGSGVRFCGGLGSVAQPINGSPMSGLWRTPPAATNHQQHYYNTAPPPPPSFAFLRGDQETKANSTASLPTGQYDDESKDGVSLDLHL